MNQNTVNKPFFDKNITLIIKGLALIMMEIHHFIMFPDWWPKNIVFPTAEKLFIYLSEPMKLCVSLFCFLTGYFYFYNKNKTLKYSIKKITDFLISYWIVFFVMAIIASVFLNYKYDIGNFLLECFALYRPTMYFCWYVYFYIVLMLILPYITKIMSKNIYFDLLLSLILIGILCNVAINTNMLNDYFILVISSIKDWIPCVLVGYIFASYNLFSKIYELNTIIIKNKSMNIIIWIIVSSFVCMGRYGFPYIVINKLMQIEINMDVLYAPIYIYSISCLCKEISIEPIKYVLTKIGKYSFLMWFISCAFFNNCKDIFQPILYMPKNEILVVIWGTILCIVPAIPIEKLSRKIQEIKNNALHL